MNQPLHRECMTCSRVLSSHSVDLLQLIHLRLPDDCESFRQLTYELKKTATNQESTPFMANLAPQFPCRLLLWALGSRPSLTLTSGPQVAIVGISCCSRPKSALLPVKRFQILWPFLCSVACKSYSSSRVLALKLLINLSKKIHE